MSTAAMDVPGAALTTTSSTLVSRLPVHDRTARLQAYDLRFGSPGDAPDVITAALLDTFSRFSADDLFGDRAGYVNLTRPFLSGQLPLPVAAGVASVRIGSDVRVDDELLTGVTRLTGAGYRLSLARDGAATAGVERLLPLVQALSVQISGRPWEAVRADADAGRALGLDLLAEDVTTRAEMERCAAEGFSLFEGPWVERDRPGDLADLSPGQAVALQLVGMLGDPGVSMDDVEDVVRRSPELAYRLLKVANSASSGARREVGSLHEAIVMVGVSRLRSWLLLLSMSGSASAEGAMLDALTRAATCERLAQATGAAGPESAFTIGLLDGVGEALGVEAERLLQHIPALATELAETLLGSPGPLRGVLDSVVTYQHGELPSQVDAGVIVDSYLNSVAWTTHTAAAIRR
ncbi:EAL and HDOD domain-containing protein [Spongisporangium articulatum]|uniref:EAL and HDOD domain-containing protein n=1 Tax=Spongisporangium articulatum TaxID=3362603 RepID=A0ABW8AI77_9ACTN